MKLMQGKSIEERMMFKSQLFNMEMYHVQTSLRQFTENIQSLSACLTTNSIRKIVVPPQATTRGISMQRKLASKPLASGNSSLCDYCRPQRMFLLNVIISSPILLDAKLDTKPVKWIEQLFIVTSTVLDDRITVGRPG